MKKILVSGCLFGWSCRYNGSSCECLHPIFVRWRNEGRLIPVCPEVSGGLSTPREPCEIIGNAVISRSGADCTAKYLAGAEEALGLAREQGAALCILKENSPSCGVRSIYDGTFCGRKIPGQGMAARLLRQAGLKVFSENELEAAHKFLAENERSTSRLTKRR